MKQSSFFLLLFLGFNCVFPNLAAAERELMEHAISEESPPAWPEKIGPFILQSDDGTSSLKFGLTVQMLVRMDSIDKGRNQARIDRTWLEMRRIRPTLRGSVLSKKLTYYLQLSTAPRSVEFLDWYLNYEIHPYAQLRLGQSKIPFTRYRIQSFKNLTLADWAIPSVYYGAERQMGLTVHSGFEKPQIFDYALGVYAGANSRSSHAVALPKLFGESQANPSNLLDPGPRSEFHPEVVARFAYNYRGIDVGTDTDWRGGPIRLSFGISGTYDFRGQRPYDLDLRLAPEFLLKAYGFSFAGLFWVAWVDTADGGSVPNTAFLSGLVQTSYLIVKRVELSVRYAIVHITKAITSDARNRADKLIAGETDPIAVEKLTEKYLNVGRHIREHELSFGVNLYIIGRSLKWQNDVSWLRHEYKTATRDDVRFRSQLQLAF
jgi:hypothetical protein